jgi:hypothetical protein
MPRRNRDWDDDYRSRDRRKKRTPIESIIAGSAFTVIFGVLLFTSRGGGWFWVFPMVAAGILPLIEGVRRLVSGKRDKVTSALEREAETEKQILRAAREQKGRLTASIAALSTNLTISEAQGALEKMAKEGYAVMNVTNDGRLEFEFPEFVPQLKSDSL